MDETFARSKCQDYCRENYKRWSHKITANVEGFVSAVEFNNVQPITEAQLKNLS
jgi:DIE2/ALG10 family